MVMQFNNLKEDAVGENDTVVIFNCFSHLMYLLY